jgi:hypothetical protein
LDFPGTRAWSGIQETRKLTSSQLENFRFRKEVEGGANPNPVLILLAEIKEKHGILLTKMKGKERTKRIYNKTMY